MKGSECKFVKYMEGADKRFVISVYQRNYDWKTETCKCGDIKFKAEDT